MAKTQTILAKSKENLFLPENLIVKIFIQKTLAGNKQIIPKPCILSDEMMQEFWVMKLINDSTAIKINITLGNKNDKEVEILSPQFIATDRIISNGNYGLSDTAFVKIVK